MTGIALVPPLRAAAAPATSPVLQWLADGLPLALLLDLFCADRLDSAEVLRREVPTPGPAPRPAA